jgi:hypothetical protein
LRELSDFVEFAFRSLSAALLDVNPVETLTEGIRDSIEEAELRRQITVMTIVPY